MALKPALCFFGYNRLHAPNEWKVTFSFVPWSHPLTLTPTTVCCASVSLFLLFNWFILISAQSHDRNLFRQLLQPISNFLNSRILKELCQHNSSTNSSPILSTYSSSVFLFCFFLISITILVLILSMSQSATFPNSVIILCSHLIKPSKLFNIFKYSLLLGTISSLGFPSTTLHSSQFCLFVSDFSPCPNL